MKSLLLLLLVPFLLIPGIAYGLSDFTTDKTYYLEGETIYISGTLENTTVSEKRLFMNAVDGSVSYVTIPVSNGYFSYEMEAGAGLITTYGNYRLTIDDRGYGRAATYFSYSTVDCREGTTYNSDTDSCVLDTDILLINKQIVQWESKINDNNNEIDSITKELDQYILDNNTNEIQKSIALLDRAIMMDLIYKDFIILLQLQIQ